MSRNRIFNFLLLSLAFSNCAAQTGEPAFIIQARRIIGTDKSIRVISLTGTAHWFAGSQNMNGPVSLKAHADGANSATFQFETNSLVETQTKAEASRTCSKENSSNPRSDLFAANCFSAIPWFAPILFTQPSKQLSDLLIITDGGDVSVGNASLHEIDYKLNVHAFSKAALQRDPSAGTMKLLFDTKSMLPTRLDYFTYPEGNDSLAIPVEVRFSDYREVSGVMIPFHIEKYLTRTLQLSIDIDNSSIE